MVEIKGVAHFSIPVSDVAKSTRFYTDIVGCKHINTVGGGKLAFLDAGGVCVILVKHDPPINPKLDDSGGVHHSFIVDSSAYKAALDHLSRVWAEELAPFGVRVLAFDPGEMNTVMHREALPDADPTTLSDPAHVARRLISALTDPSVPTGARLTADGYREAS